MNEVSRKEDDRKYQNLYYGVVVVLACDILSHVKSFFCNRESMINIFRDVYIKATKR